MRSDGKPPRSASTGSNSTAAIPSRKATSGAGPKAGTASPLGMLSASGQTRRYAVVIGAGAAAVMAALILGVVL